jgi:hypothetical protein
MKRETRVSQNPVTVNLHHQALRTRLIELKNRAKIGRDIVAPQLGDNDEDSRAMRWGGAIRRACDASTDGGHEQAPETAGF